jgi:DNA primase
VALGLFGPRKSEFKAIRKAAEHMCQQFDARFPDAGSQL